jgi:hypothetical protein
LVALASENPCITDDDSDENGPDLYAWDIHRGLLTLLETVPADERSLELMAWVLNRVDPGQARTPDKNPQSMIDRWSNVKITGEHAKRLEYLSWTSLPFNEEFACLLVAMYGEYLAGDERRCVGSLGSPDVVRRCAFYGTQKMTVDQMVSAYEQDKEAFTLAALCNDSLFHNSKTRTKLEDCVTGPRLFFRYLERCRQIRKRWPQFELGPVTETMRETWADELPKPSDEQNSLDRLEQRLSQLQARVAGLSRLGQWALIGIVAILVLLLWRRHA